jgi:hypothetical protein
MTNYYLYTPVTFSVRSDVKKIIRQSNPEEIQIGPWQRQWIEMLECGLITSDLTTPLTIVEHQWLKSPIAYLPETASLVTQLLKTNDTGQVKALKTPADQFCIAMPKSVRFNEQCIGGIFVSFVAPCVSDQYKYQFAEDFDVPPRPDMTRNDIDKIDPQLFIAYQVDSKGQHYVIRVDLWKLNWILEAETEEIYGELSGEIGANLFAETLTPNEKKTQFELLRFVVAFIVYLSAHENVVSSTDNIKMTGAQKNSKPIELRTVQHIKPSDHLIP